MKLSLEPEHYARFEKLIAERLGMRCDESMRERIQEVVNKRMRQQGLVDPGTYLDRLEAQATARAELRALAQELTVGETYFFRGPDHFRAFAQAVLPQCLRARADTRCLRVLSAGCASGEEAYSLAILLREGIPELESWRLDVVGVDINPSFLAKAAKGVYTGWSLRDVPAQTVERNFGRNGNHYVLDQAIRNMVRFEERNLLEDDEFWRGARFDIIFCRNVLIYFTVEAMMAALGRLERALAPEAYLFLGHSETLRGLSRAFHLCQTHDTFYYQLRAGAAVEVLAAEPVWPASSLAEVGEAGAAADASWVDAIQGAADRITALAARAPSAQQEPEPCPQRDYAAQAMDLFRRESYDEAAQLIRALLPGRVDTSALLLLAAALTNRGQVAEAEGVCRRLLLADELNAEADYLLALCREHVGDRAGAIKHARTAAYLDPHFAMPHLLLGRLARRGGNPEQAQHELRRTLELIVRQDATHTLLFGGGFSREALTQLCRAELAACGVAA